MEHTRYVVGVDLGTTNSAIAYVDTGAGEEEASKIRLLPVPQITDPGEARERPQLPSFHYHPAPSELPAGSLALPWDASQEYAVGEMARKLGEKIPRRLVSSAKSWLCHEGVDRKAPILPWGSEEDVPKISPLEATQRLLLHLKAAWNHAIASETEEHRLGCQEVYLTVPASFDAVARDLTAQAAEAAGFQNVTLLEEPQAAFYSWLESKGDDWRNEVRVGDQILVCDIGGGTTDFTLIAVGEEAGSLTLERVAVGEHILLGGDNMDLALAHVIRGKLEEQGQKLDIGQTLMLWHSCRRAKEQMLNDPDCKSLPITVVGRGSKLIGGTLQADLGQDEMMKTILDGFFPSCEVDDRPVRQRRAGLQELGLIYESDPAVPKHIAKFLGENLETSSGKQKTAATFLHPTAILFNGGVVKGQSIRERIVGGLNGWLKAEKAKSVRILQGVDLDLAVARGASYYGLVRRGKGIRIRGGLSRTYYVGIETPMPAVPGMRPPIKAVCVAPFGMEEGTEVVLPEQEFGLVVGEPAEFRFLSSTTRHDEAVGEVLEDWEDAGLEELAPLEALLKAKGQEGATIPVRLRCRVTEIGTLELWCVARDESGEWKLEFNVRETGS